ncbi:MAG: DNA helicase RecQ [Oscillospiraceae bacterium]|jgi:ATP-dependent DNA helicase RecQ|nr:DNA helicase RecQ [Oscillospiraceae bacterium]
MTQGNSPAPEQILKQYYGYETFRPGQGDIVENILRGRDALGIMPTGAGKSICYQVPAMLFGGVTLVISPLISLMRDQVQALCASGIPAAYINSSLTPRQTSAALSNARQGKYKLIYIAPERLFAPSTLELTHAVEISMVAIDEAHCISQWGHDFRVSYLDIPAFIEGLPKRPIVTCFTATATERVREDILSTLGLEEPFMMTTGFDRPNLYFEVRHPAKKYEELSTYLEKAEGAGIVYCATRKEVESVTEKLIADGFSAARYHAGLSDYERGQAQDDFLYDKIDIIVATNAFGMGIDKPNVRYVVHYNMPQNLEEYYQQAGRAGRDGLPADCILFFARKDIVTALFLINRSDNQEEIRRARQLLNQMEGYCQTEGCLRTYFLNYFGESTSDDCGNCGSCNGGGAATDVTVDAQKLLSCIMRINRQNRSYGFAVISKILRGKADDAIRQRELDKLPTFGAMKGVSSAYIRRIYDKLAATKMLAVSDDEYMTATATAAAGAVVFGGERVFIAGAEDSKAVSKSGGRSKSTVPVYGVAEPLLASLKAMRKSLADEQGVPAFVIFSDATLVDMAQKRPKTLLDMRSVSGVGAVKCQRYGEQFLQTLLSFQDNAEALERPPEFSAEALRAAVLLSDEPLPVSRVADLINAVLVQYGIKKMSAVTMNKLLIAAGYLEAAADGSKVPTARGREAGLATIERSTNHGDFTQCVFARAAQAVCVELAVVYCSEQL